MKFLKIFMLFLFANVGLHAQEVILDDVQLRAFSGIKTMGENYYFFSREGSNETKGESDFQLTYMDQDLNVFNEKVLSLSKYSNLAGSAASSTNVLMVFYDFSKRSITYKVFDPEGNEVASKQELKVKYKFLYPDYYPNIFVYNEKFIVIKPTKDDKIGYSITMLDNDLNEVFSETFAPEKKTFQLIDVHYLNGKIFLLRQTASGKKFTNEIVCHDASDGSEIYTYNLYDGEKSGYPTFIKVNSEEKVYTAGMYFEGEKTSNSDSDGFFYLSLDPSGKSVDYETHDWEEVKKVTKEPATMLLWGGKNKLVVHDIILKADNSLSIVAEGYAKKKKGKDRFIYTLGDLSIFDFNSDGYFENARKIIKPDQTITVLTGETVRSLKMAMELKRAGYFPYKYAIEKNGKHYLVFSIITAEKKAFGLFVVPAKSYYFIPLEAYGIEDAVKVEIRAPYSNDGKGKGNIFNSMSSFDETVYDKTETSMNSPVYNYAAMSGVQWIDGKLVYTNYEMGKQSVRFWIEDVPFDE